MDTGRQKFVDIDVGRAPFSSRDESPTFRLHYHGLDETTHSMESPRFACFGRAWKAHLWPNYPQGAISLDLKMDEEDYDDFSVSDASCSDDASDSSDDGEGMNIRFTACVKDLGGKVVRERGNSHIFNSWDDQSGINQLMDRSVVIGPSSNILRDGTLTVELRMRILKRRKNSICQPFVPYNPLLQNIRKLFLDQKTADVAFAVQKEEGGEVAHVHAHRFVLQMAAKSLAAFCDVDNGVPITITRVDPHVFKLLLLYAYGGAISSADWDEHALDLIDAADLYGIVNLKLEAEARYIQCTKVSLDNAVDLLAYSDAKQCAQLKEVVMDFVVKNKIDVLRRMTSLRNVPESSTMFTDLLAAMARGDKKIGCDSEDRSFGPLDIMRVGDLRRMLHEHGLDVDGSRETLVSRLRRSLKKSRKRARRDADTETE